MSLMTKFPLYRMLHNICYNLKNLTLLALLVPNLEKTVYCI